MAKPRKSKYEKLVETAKKAEQYEHEVAALRAQIQAEERKKDTRRKVLDGAMSFAHARIDPEYRELHANVLHKVGAAMKTERAQAEAAELEKYVRAGCPDMDIDRRIEEIQRAKNAPAPANVAPPSPPPGKPRNPSPQG
jgi:hypothetical protein